MKKTILITSIIFIVNAVFFTAIDWSIGGFELLKAQKYEFYFQSWISFAGIAFTFIMAVTTFIIYKRNQLASLKFLSLAFLLTSLAYFLIGYHSSYCQLCSDLSLCSTSHNYSDYFIIIAIVIATLTVLLVNLKNNITLLKFFSYGIILASFFMLLILILSIQFMENPSLLAYEVKHINLQGFVFIFPLIFIALFYIYFKNTYKLTYSISFLFFLLFISFIPQAYHVFLCSDCYNDECSEFFVFSGFIMYMVIGLIIYSISLQLQENKK